MGNVPSVCVCVSLEKCRQESVFYFAYDNRNEAIFVISHLVWILDLFWLFCFTIGPVVSGGLDAAIHRRRTLDPTPYEQLENVDNPLRCPVKLYEFYLSKWWVYSLLCFSLQYWRLQNGALKIASGCKIVLCCDAKLSLASIGVCDLSVYKPYILCNFVLNLLFKNDSYDCRSRLLQGFSWYITYWSKI